MADHNLFQEIEEDLQRQKIEALWKRYGNYVIAGALAIVLMTAAITSWKAYKVRTEQAATAGILDILATTATGENADRTKEITALEDFAKSRGGTSQAVLARFYAASIAVDKEKRDEALTMYNALANDTAIEPHFRELADLMAVQLQFDRADPAVLQARLQPLLKDSAWSHSAKEMSAHLALKAGDKEKAKQLFNELTQEKGTSTSILQRAADMLRWLNEKA